MLPTNKFLEHRLCVSEPFEAVSESEIYKLYAHSLITRETSSVKIRISSNEGYELQPSYALGDSELRAIAAKIILTKIKKYNIKQIVLGNIKDHTLAWPILCAAPEINIATMDEAEHDRYTRNKMAIDWGAGLYGHLEKDLPIWLFGGNLIHGKKYINQISVLKNTYRFKVCGLITLFADLNNIGIEAMRTAQYLSETSQENNISNKNKFIYDYCIGTMKKLNFTEEVSLPFWSGNSVAYV